MRPFGSTALYSHVDYYPGYPYCHNTNGIEITVMRFIILPGVTIRAVWRSPKVSATQVNMVLTELLDLFASQQCIFVGEFNVDWFNETQRMPLLGLFERHNYQQIETNPTTDNKTCIDRVYTNLAMSQMEVHVLETYFSDHMAIAAAMIKFL